MTQFLHFIHGLFLILAHFVFIDLDVYVCFVVGVVRRKGEPPLVNTQGNDADDEQKEHNKQAIHCFLLHGLQVCSYYIK